MKYLIISTYPELGSQNIGDKLIEKSTVALLKSQDSGAEFSTLWREETVTKARPYLDSCDVIVFACFAIRSNMRKLYPFVDAIFESKKPIMIISAGTSRVVTSDQAISDEIQSDSLDIIRKLEKQSILFTSRARLTHVTCRSIGLTRARYTGDVAFFDRRFSGRTFKNDYISSIIISDPHREKFYLDHTQGIISGLKQRFPNAKLAAAIHGNQSIDFTKVCIDNGLTVHEAFKEPESGLDIYDQYDLHIGYRVHGHVSALKRRKISYLLEQDGRGLDYGLSFSRKISIPAMMLQYNAGWKKDFLSRLGLKKKSPKYYVPPSCIEQVLSLLDRDIEGNFSSFLGLEKEIDAICNTLSESIAESLRQIGR